jgi:hypothetical protein
MAKADTSVKYFHSAMPGAPVLNGTAGSLIAILDACLVNGFGLKTVDSLVVAGNVATANISTGHSAEKDTVVLIAGATPAELNGEWKVASTTTTTITFVTAGILDQTAAGTITLKLAPAGWAKPFSGTNLAAYKPTDVTATGCLLRVDDTLAKTARLVGYETMSDVNTGTGPFPTVAQKSGGVWWSKSNAADASSRPWVLVSDGRFFYSGRAHYPAFATNGNGYELAVFGDFLPTKSSDPFGATLTGQAADTSSADPVILNNYWYSAPTTTTDDLYIARSYTGLGSSIRLVRTMPSLLATTINWTSGGFGGPYPNPPDGGLYVVPHFLFEGTTLIFRGTSPGFYGCPQVVPTGSFAARDSVTGVTGLPGKTLKALTCTSSGGVCFFDITGPWR